MLGIPLSEPLDIEMMLPERCGIIDSSCGLRAAEVALEVDIQDVVPLLLLEVPQVLDRGDACTEQTMPSSSRTNPAHHVDDRPAPGHGGDVFGRRHGVTAHIALDLGHHDVCRVRRPGLVVVERTAVVRDDHRGPGIGR